MHDNVQQCSNMESSFTEQFQIINERISAFISSEQWSVLFGNRRLCRDEQFKPLLSVLVCDFGTS